MQLGLRGARVAASRELDLLGTELAHQHHVRLPAVIAADLGARIDDLVPKLTFESRNHGAIASEECARPDTLTELLAFVFNDPVWLQAVQTIVGCDEVGCFDGRIYRFAHGHNHGHDWHRDVDGNRLAALSVTLTHAAFSGGALEIREGTDGAVQQVRNPVFGDAVLFRIADDVYHRVTAPQPGPAKIAYAGWFCRTPKFHDLLRQPG